MKAKQACIWIANALIMASSAALALPANAEPIAPAQPQVAPMSEPYEPGSSSVVNDWQFKPGEPTTIASNYRSHHHNSGHCRNSHRNHSS